MVIYCLKLILNLYKSFIKISSLSKKINMLSINSRKLSYKFDSEIIDNQFINILKTLNINKLI